MARTRTILRRFPIRACLATLFAVLVAGLVVALGVGFGNLVWRHFPDQAVVHLTDRSAELSGWQTAYAFEVARVVPGGGAAVGAAGATTARAHLLARDAEVVLVAGYILTALAGVGLAVLVIVEMTGPIRALRHRRAQVEAITAEIGPTGQLPKDGAAKNGQRAERAGPVPPTARLWSP